ncbi:hypothetical protein BX600DRAFT_518998 [Xylariales sp. PMI_506]|nr:hypothetical protein BX600DRAFT_518998 [Xylariales sp. PMI_506]
MSSTVSVLAQDGAIIESFIEVRMVRLAKVSEAIPLGDWRRQAKAKLAPPTTSFKGKTVLLVGATGVILSEAARIIADLDVSTFIFGIRSLKKGEALATELREKHGDKLSISLLEVDLLSFKSVVSFVAKLHDFERIDVIVMGSAIMNNETRVTKDGWEETLQLVHLSSALLIVLLLPKMLSDGQDQPVVLSSVSSSAARASAHVVNLPSKPEDSYIEQIHLVKTPEFQRKNQYGICKLVHMFWIQELCSYLPAETVQFHQLDPGACFTPLSADLKMAQLLLRWIGRPVNMCARTVVNSCLPFDGSHGKMFLDYDIIPYPKFMDRPPGKELRQRAWTETMQILTDQVPETIPIFTNQLRQVKP